MKTFACGKVVPGCGREFIAPTEAEIVLQARMHAAEAHGLRELDAATLTTVRSLIGASSELSGPLERA
jgi:predicted small metal-binding protein